MSCVLDCLCPPCDSALLLRQALADVVEALVGAVYLDSGGNLHDAERCVARVLSVVEEDGKGI